MSKLFWRVVEVMLLYILCYHSGHTLPSVLPWLQLLKQGRGGFYAQESDNPLRKKKQLKTISL